MAFLHTSGGSEKKSVTQPRRALRGWLIGVSVFIVVVLVGLGGLLAYDVVYADRIYKGVAINGVDLAGMTRQQAYDTLQEIEQNLQASGIVFQHEQQSITLQPVIIPTDDPDLAKPILQYDWRRTLDLSQGYGRLSNPFANAVQKLRAASIGISLQPYVEIDETELLKILRERFNEFERPPVDAQLRIVNGQAEVQSEIDGFVFTYESALRQLRDQALEFHFSPISLSLEPRAAQIKKAETGSAVAGLNSVLDIPEITLTFQGRNWRISQATLHDWLAFQRTGEGDVVVGLKPQDLEEFLSLIAQDINVESQDAKFEITNNRVVEFQPSLEGREVDIEATIDLINGMILLGANVGDAPESAQTLELVVAVTPPKVAVGQLNELGIKEKLGEGRSNFAGSPANRRHNIAVGVASLNGILIAPDETFSQLSALGEIEASTGYLPELVIKGDRTIPEYGGGLCQISSTTFR
ncbi:MAG TPA: peptidoglycan binding domain-containing protein, partial [Candidatus Saccharimonadales bacterium]